MPEHLEVPGLARDIHPLADLGARTASTKQSDISPKKGRKHACGGHVRATQ
jgi:hypothetical protein